jgi:hypothetical protein
MRVYVYMHVCECMSVCVCAHPDDLARDRDTLVDGDENAGPDKHHQTPSAGLESREADAWSWIWCKYGVFAWCQYGVRMVSVWCS